MTTIGPENASGSVLATSFTRFQHHIGEIVLYVSGENRRRIDSSQTQKLTEKYDLLPVDASGLFDPK